MSGLTGSRRNGTRAVVVSALAAVLVLGIVGPARAAEVPSGTGTSALTIVPGSLAITSVPVPVDTSLGTLVADATNSDNPVARLLLSGIGVAGQQASDFAVSSADGNQSGNEERSADVAGVGATVGLVDYAVQSGADTATAGLSALGAAVTTPIGLGANVAAQQLSTQATPTSSAASTLVTISGLQLGLDDLLPPDVLDALPLSVILDLIDSLGLPLPAGLTGQITDLDSLLTTLQDAVAAAGNLDSLQSQIASLTTSLPAVTSAQSAVDDALAQLAAATAGLTDAQSAAGAIPSLQSQVTSLTGQINALEALPILLPAQQDLLDSLTSQLSGVQDQISTLQGAVTAAQAAVTSAQSVLASAQAALDSALAAAGTVSSTLQGLLDQLPAVQDLLDGLLGQLDGLLGGTGGLNPADLRGGLLGALTGTPLLDLGSIDLRLDTVADGVSSSGAVTCSAEGLTILGQAVPTPACADVGAALDTLTGAIGDALAALPLAVPLPAIDTGGLETTSSGSGVPDANGVSTAVAQVSALTLDIAPVELTGVVDGLVSQLDGLISQLDGLVPGLDLVGAAPVQLATVGTAPTGSASALAVPADLESALGTLQGVLDTLPTGSALDGLSTAGISAALGTVNLQSSFASAATPVTPGSPSGPSTPGAPDLPRTGTDEFTLFMAALAALAAGAVTMALSRSSELGMLRLPGDDDRSRLG